MRGDGGREGVHGSGDVGDRRALATGGTAQGTGATSDIDGTSITIRPGAR